MYRQNHTLDTPTGPSESSQAHQRIQVLFVHSQEEQGKEGDTKTSVDHQEHDHTTTALLFGVDQLGQLQVYEQV